MKLPSPFRAKSEPETPALEAAAPAVPALEPIRLILADEDISGWVQPRGERVTDLLQTGIPLWVRSADSAADWRPIEPSELLIVVPPPHTSPPERRVPRQLHEVFIRLGRWVVTGTAHMVPGEEVDPYLHSTRPFLPLTNASIGTGAEQVEAIEVVIVNLRRSDEFRVL